MLPGFPLYRWFENGNPYSGAHYGMRYLLEPKKKPDPTDPAGKKTIKFLLATVWPEPWAMEHTAPEKLQSREFSSDQEGLDAAAAWLRQVYEKDEERWQELPSVLDSASDR